MKSGGMFPPSVIRNRQRHHDGFHGVRRRVNFSLMDIHCGTPCFIFCDIEFLTLERCTSKMFNLIEGEKSHFLPFDSVGRTTMTFTRIRRAWEHPPPLPSHLCTPRTGARKVTNRLCAVKRDVPLQTPIFMRSHDTRALLKPA